MILAKVHKANDRVVLALCDSELFGKRYTEEDKQLDLTSEFFKGEPVERDFLEQLVHGASCILAIGKEAIAALVGMGVLQEKETRTIAGIPYAHLVLT